MNKTPTKPKHVINMQLSKVSHAYLEKEVVFTKTVTDKIYECAQLAKRMGYTELQAYFNSLAKDFSMASTDWSFKYLQGVNEWNGSEKTTTRKARASSSAHLNSSGSSRTASSKKQPTSRKKASTSRTRSAQKSL